MKVSILTERERPARPPEMRAKAIAWLVSILTERERPARLSVCPGVPNAEPCFNPHRARTPGATSTEVSSFRRNVRFQSSPSANARRDGSLRLPRTRIPWSFNPHRARTPGATISAVVDMQSWTRFQSSPSANARRDPGGGAGLLLPCTFQSSPSANARRDTPSQLASNEVFGFNPHRARTPGAT